MFGIYKALGKGLVSSAHGLSPFSRLAWAHSHSNVKVPSTARGHAQYSRAFKASACNTFANVPLVKVRHTVKPDSRSGQIHFTS